MDLFTPVTLGDLELANRVVMAPLTRMRSGASGVPGDLVVEHYAQRAGVGLIVTEGTYPDHESQAFVGQPGIVTDEQAAGWRARRRGRARPRRPDRAAGDARRPRHAPRRSTAAAGSSRPAPSRSTARRTPRRASSPTRCRTR